MGVILQRFISKPSSSFLISKIVNLTSKTSWLWPCLGCFLSLSLPTFAIDTAASFRPPAVPLVTSDPYLSIWSMGDQLTATNTAHWTDRAQPLVSLIRIDGKTWRLMGRDPQVVPAFPQVGVKVTPTRSIYDFDDERVHVTLTFMTPALPDQLDILARPLTYLTWEIHSVDGQNHAVSIYDSTSTALAVAEPTQGVTWQREPAGSITALKCGVVNQTLFEPRGDHVRIDWGYAYAAAPAGQSKACIGSEADLEKEFTGTGDLPDKDDVPPAVVKERHPAMAFIFNLGSVGSEAVSRHVMITYDELYEIKFSGQKLLPYWKRDGATASELLQGAEKDYAGLIPQCENFDQRLMTDMTKVGGADYAQIGALAYRQTLAGCGLAADANKQPLFFTKENTSNGDIATVDVLFPASPLFLLVSPTLAKALVVPALAYAASDRWKFPNAPHDLGTYPVGSATGDAGEAMPVEESGNLLILCDAIAKADGNTDFVAPWWPQLTRWAKFLEQYGLDPENQLCTDDFMGHLAHNSNLSIKAIIALGAYGDLCERRGDSANATKYRDMARADALHWMKAADDGDHYRIAFDQPNTWSQKYNLVWDKILGLHIFPLEVARKELAYYKSKMNIYGVPLDSRTKLGDMDHVFFSATLADDPADFGALIHPSYTYLSLTSIHVPLADTYQTDQLHGWGMHARPVVGGIFARMLTAPEVWKKWAAADTAKPGPWAPIPPLPVLSVLLPADPKTPFIWRYTTQAPASDWTSATFDDSTWLQAASTAGKPNPDPKNPKKVLEVDAWRRLTLALPDRLPSHLQWILSGISNGEIYINGVLAGIVASHGNREAQDIPPAAQPFLQPGATILIAVHTKGRNDGMIDIALGTTATPGDLPLSTNEAK